ncbi:nitrate reductase [candidate division LCP-89 bacterium B3_LCP]|uniref:Periplasmic nitrate reductase, electron transfer subunit n=1 Tax=candidate division LCP-89 bacterium B3_LCP TaxID=2012998 RepID=A0A532UU73_UNCL8|nr:MAG: nitrate reductase [candidate division LCP-89 bacterium B3_LCP]
MIEIIRENNITKRVMPMQKGILRVRALKVLAAMLLVIPFLICSCSGDKTIEDGDLGIRKGTLLTEDVLVPESTTSLVEAGASERVARSFENAPPMIPHEITDYVPITIEENACTECHMPEVAEDAEATPVPASHLYDLRENQQLSELSGAAFNCTLCHAAMTDASLIVENEFTPEFRDDGDEHSSDLLDRLNEGIE